MDRDALNDVFNFLAGFTGGAMLAQVDNKFNPEMHFPLYLRPAVWKLMTAAHAADENCREESEKWRRAANIVQFELRAMGREMRVSLPLGDWSWHAILECMQ